MVGAAGFEPATARTPSVCATRLRYAPILIIRTLGKSGLPNSETPGPSRYQFGKFTKFYFKRLLAPSIRLR